MILIRFILETWSNAVNFACILQQKLEAYEIGRFHNSNRGPPEVQPIWPIKTRSRRRCISLQILTIDHYNFIIKQPLKFLLSKNVIYKVVL